MIKIGIRAVVADENGNHEQEIVIQVPVWSYGRSGDGPITGMCELGKFEFQPHPEFQAFGKNDPHRKPMFPLAYMATREES